MEEAYFGTDGKPVRDKKGYAKLTHRYDAQGGLIEEAYFGPDGEPAANEQGYSRKVYTKDSRGFDIETAYFGIDGQPILNDRGFARAKIINDDLGRDIEWSYFGIRGEPVIGKRRLCLPSGNKKTGCARQPGRGCDIRIGWQADRSGRFGQRPPLREVGPALRCEQ